MQAATSEVPFHPPCLSTHSDSSYHWKAVLQVTAAISRTPFSHTCLTDLQKCEAFAMRFVIWVFKISSFFCIIVFILQNTSFCISNNGKNVFLAFKNKNNLGNQKLIKGEILAAHLTHLPPVKDNSNCVSELLCSRCAAELRGCAVLLQYVPTAPFLPWVCSRKVQTRFALNKGNIKPCVSTLRSKSPHQAGFDLWFAMVGGQQGPF